LRANIDYGFTAAKTKAGILGIKCWICTGEDKPSNQAEEVIETGAVESK
jgi:ribosomal protein S3